MKTSIKTRLLMLSTAIVVLLSFNAAIPEPPAPPPYEDPDTYEQEPPFVENIWLKKLNTPLQTGENLRIKIKYLDEFNPPPTLTIYYGDGEEVVIYDDGTNGDETEDDNIYTGFIEEDLTALSNTLESFETDLTTDGGYLTFTGHAGASHHDIPVFDKPKFDDGIFEVEVDKRLLEAMKCGIKLKKQNTLFITDISVVDDGARTYNALDQSGNQYGAWTFGTLMTNMAGSSVTPKAFIKSWLQHWMTDQTVNMQTIPKRGDVLFQLIRPWISAARGDCSYGGNFGEADWIANWETYWDNTNEDALLANAPFKLTAIVNRLDLRGTGLYRGLITNAGETRFIFSLYAPCGQTNSPQGLSVRHLNQDFVNPNPSFFDWEGMNVIFEYGNVQTGFCQLKAFAQSWANLDNLTLGSSAFNYALEQITNTVTLANAAPGKPNGSAINRIRTNEKVFGSPAAQTGIGWADVDWEFRQFEINSANGLLKQVPLTNTPLNTTNFSNTLNITGGSQTGTYYNNSNLHNTTHGTNLINLVYASPIMKLRLLNDNHTFPATYPTSTDPILSGGATVQGEHAHHWDLKWDPNETVKYQISSNPPYNPAEKEIRRRVSLNTCQGCHTGETKTMFTQVIPRGYEYSQGQGAWIPQEAKYWTTIPDYEIREIDTRGTAENTGKTTIAGYGQPDNYTKPQYNGYRVAVSPFLTGRSYTGPQGSGTFADDNPFDLYDADWDEELSLFEVNDPVNGPSILQPSTTQFGYNDLERRRKDLCKLIYSDCANGGALDIITKATHIPFAIGMH